MRSRTAAVRIGLAAMFVLVSTTVALAYPVVNGMGDNQADAYGYYYAVTGGLFPTGPTPNGSSASGGTFRYYTDDPIWGVPIDTWHKDGWYSGNAGIGVTLRNNASIVYDNNGIETGTSPAGYYTYNASTFPTEGAGAVVAFSMANDYDWIYAGYLQLTAPTTVTQITGYFLAPSNPSDALTGPFDPNSPIVSYHMNLWSNVAGDLLPVNTGSFLGDVFSSDTTAGIFAWSDTGLDRTGSSTQQDIYRLTYTLATPLELEPGTYWFNHNATIPAPPALVLLGLGVVALATRRRR